MSKIRSKGNKSTEKRLRAHLVSAGIRGWHLNAKHIVGTPDVVFEAERLALFVDGCFWHGCPDCYRRPKTRRKFWDAKVEGNRLRDRRVNGQLKRRGWRVLRFFECTIREQPHEVLRKILSSRQNSIR